MIPETPQPPAVMQRLASFVTPRPSFRDTCNGMARRFRAMASEMYDVGDQSRGDYYTTRALTWEFARDTDDLTVLRELP